jgi:pimeloyl-ACP methyl ester carboxylesterase
MRRLACCVLLVAMGIGATPSGLQAQTLKGVGVVLMHGKGGSPNGLTAPLAAALESNGAAVVSPLMPWHGSRGRPQGYMEGHDQALGKIDRAVAELKAGGASKIVVAGQSFGANMALAYAAKRGQGLAGVIVMAPGHMPERPKFMALVQPGVAKARELVASGRGDTAVALPDINQGETFQVRARAAAYLSFFDPQGAAVMPRNAAAMPSLPLLWIVGRSDPLFPLGERYAYARAPKNAKSKYVAVNAGHRDTPTAARQDVIAWLKAL